MNDETITIKKSEYDSLQKRSAWLGDLESAGVDNWEGYDFACNLRRERLGDKAEEDDE